MKNTYLLSMFVVCVVNLASCKTTQSSELKELGLPIGGLRGLDLINRQIQHVLLAPRPETPRSNNSNFQNFSGEFTILNYLESQPGTIEISMGAYDVSERNNDFKGGDPNPFNMTLWYLALQGFGKRVGKSCDQSSFDGFIPAEAIASSVTFNAKALGILKILCAAFANSELDAGNKATSDMTQSPKTMSVLVNKPAKNPAAKTEKPDDATLANELNNFCLLLLGPDVPDECLVIRDYMMQQKTSLKSGQDFISQTFLAITFNPHFLLVKR